MFLDAKGGEAILKYEAWYGKEIYRYFTNIMYYFLGSSIFKSDFCSLLFTLKNAQTPFLFSFHTLKWTNSLPKISRQQIQWAMLKKKGIVHSRN